MQFLSPIYMEAFIQIEALPNNTSHKRAFLNAFHLYGALGNIYLKKIAQKANNDTSLLVQLPKKNFSLSLNLVALVKVLRIYLAKKPLESQF